MHDPHSHTGVYIAVAASLIVSLVANYFMIQWPKIEEVGGKDNFKLYQKMVKHPDFAKNVRQSIQSQLDSLDGKAPSNDNNNSDTPSQAEATGTLSSSDIVSLQKNTSIKGNKSALLLWVEYSDLECPFCKKLHDSGAIKNLGTKYGDKLAYVFKHYPLPFHTNALPAAQAAECVGEAKGGTKFYDFIEQVFVKGVPTQDVIETVIKSIGLDVATIKKCVESNKFKSIIDGFMDEGSNKFGVNGTPGNILINTKNGKYEVISGAQPESNFDAAIQRLLAE